MPCTTAGDWTTPGTIPADVSIFRTTEPIPQFSTQDQIADQQAIVLPFAIPSGTARAEIRLGWREDWGRYPSADVDLILIAPGGAANLTGATVNNPEVVGIDKPAAGMWTAVVFGSDVPTGSDKFELRVSLDGNVLKIK